MTEDRLPQDGDTVDVDYSGTDEEGNKIDDVQGENFGVALGQGQALPDFEALVKTAKVGEEKTGPVNFPADYPHKPLAGKTVIFTIKVNKIQTSQKPEVNEEFAQKVGQESLEKMKASIVEHVSATKAQAARSEAMKKLIDGLLEKVSFEIPDSMLNARVERVVQEQAMKLQRMGLDDLRKDQAQEEKREEAKKEALETLRPQVFLMALAQKENITVNDQEVEMAIYGMAMRAQQDYKKVSEAYHKSGLIYELRDRILADKALEMVYSKAKINEVPAVSLSEPKNALTRQYQKLFELDNVTLRFTSDALRAIAHRAIERKTGARGLRNVMESVMLDIMYQLPSMPGVKECVINDAVIEKKAPPLYIYDTEAHIAS